MHNNFYFLRQLSKQLASTLTGSVVSECFSQSKDELILRFEISGGSFLIKASLLPGFSCLSFPDNFQRARKNSVDLFPQLIGGRVKKIRQFNNERSFAIELVDGTDLLFKMHGNRTNILLFQKDAPTQLFRNNIVADVNLTLDALDREIDWSFENFKRNANDLKRVYFTFGKTVWEFLQEHNFYAQDLQARWQAIQELLKLLREPTYYITFIKDVPVLSLVQTGEIKKIWHDPLEAANDFYYTFTHVYAFSKEKAQVVSFLKTKLDAGYHYHEKNSARIRELEKDNNYKVWADLVMANLHNIPPRSEKITLDNFYNDNNPAEIKLKKDLSPQRNAEIFYKKAKNQHIEIERLKESLILKEKETEALRHNMELVEAAADLKSLRILRAQINPHAESKARSEPLPYHEHTYQGYTIWVGKNAQANDVLTSKYGYKEDLWLHAKDVAGSHVLIKHQSGKNFPKDVIEHAASLAAFHSKRKNESLCPVVVTPRKFVRKRKGDPAGAVVVDREEVVMVVPARIN